LKTLKVQLSGRLDKLTSEWFDNQKKSSNNFRKLLKKRIDKANPRRELTAEEAKRLARLEVIADKLKRGENVQNR
jgi:hypothetical protein